MRITIDVSAANDPDAHPWLDRILHTIEDGWHVWDLTETPDADAIEATTWVSDPGRQGSRLHELLIASTQRSAWTLAPHTRCVRVTAHPAAPDELAPKQASRLADEPLVILVENRDSDGAFVARVVTELDKSLHGVWRREEEPIRFDSVGGTGQMPQEVERRTRAVPYRPRLVAVIDSDRKGPGDSESGDARRLRRVCDEHGLPCWVLAKREAENYLPRVLLAARPNASAEHARMVEAWERLSDDQKDFFDMKRGLPEDPTAITAIEEDLGVTSDRLLPYGLQLVLLGEFHRICPQPAAGTVELLRRWFWVTSFTGWFGGVNTAQAKRALEEIRDLARGESETFNVVDLDAPALPFPDRFDARSARVRAFLLYLASLGPRSLKGGANLNPGPLLSLLGTHAVGYVWSNPDPPELVSSPANRLFVDEDHVGQALGKLSRLDADALRTHGFSIDSIGRLRDDDRTGLIRARLATLIEGERAFMEKQIVTLPAERTAPAIADSEASDDE